MPERKNNCIRMMIIYNRPKDYPDHYVTRLWVIKNGKSYPNPNCYLNKNLADSRRNIPADWTNIGRQEGDEPQIEEVWIE